MKELYPIGTVALLEGGTKRVMVTGYMITEADAPEKVYDYCGVLYPEGSLSSDQVLLFDHSQIKTVYGVGYKDDEYDHFMSKLLEILALTEEEKKSILSNADL